MKNILIVDDEFEITDILRWLFEWNGYKVYTAGSGLEALSIIENQSVDIFIIDWMMPGMSGMQLAEKLKNSEATRNVPIIMMSAGMIEEAEPQYDYFFRKPLLFQDLLSEVKRLLR
jgi:DNA-binding response OmpR family regulator